MSVDSQDKTAAAALTGSGHVLLVTTCWWLSVARFAHLMGQTGCRVSVLCPVGHPVTALPDVMLYNFRWRNPLAALSDAIAASRPDIIIAGDDRSVGYLHQLHASGSPAIRQLIEKSIGRAESFPVTASRSRLLALARTLGVRTPAGDAIKNEPQLAAWMDEQPGPWVLKRSGSWGGMGVCIVDSKQAAFAAFRKLRAPPGYLFALKRFLVNRDAFWLMDMRSSREAEVSVQSFVAGRRTDLAVFCWGGAVLAATMAETIMSDSPAGPSTLVKLIDSPTAHAAANILTRDLGLSGFFGLDFIIEETSGTPYLIELNPRLTPLSNIRGDAAADLVGHAAGQIGGQKNFAPKRAAKGDFVVYFRNDSALDLGHLFSADIFFDFPYDNAALMAERLRISWPDRHWLARIFIACRTLGTRERGRLRFAPLRAPET